jgi:hypothetical protein
MQPHIVGEDAGVLDHDVLAISDDGLEETEAAKADNLAMHCDVRFSDGIDESDEERNCACMPSAHEAFEVAFSKERQCT